MLSNIGMSGLFFFRENMMLLHFEISKCLHTTHCTLCQKFNDIYYNNDLKIFENLGFAYQILINF